MGLFLDPGDLAVRIKFNHAIALGIAHQIAENQSPPGELDGTPQNFGKTRTIENIVAQHQTNRILSDKRFADDKGLGQSFGTRLLGIGKRQPQVGPVTEDFAKYR